MTQTHEKLKKKILFIFPGEKNLIDTLTLFKILAKKASLVFHSFSKFDSFIYKFFQNYFRVWHVWNIPSYFQTSLYEYLICLIWKCKYHFQSSICPVINFNSENIQSILRIWGKIHICIQFIRTSKISRDEDLWSNGDV